MVMMMKTGITTVLQSQLRIGVAGCRARIQCCSYAVVALLACCCLSASAQEKAPSLRQAQDRLNVIFILADDLGWADTTLYGKTSLYQTPNLERLAKRGMTFNRAYANSPLCSPTRASILTGQTPLRHGSVNPVHHGKSVSLTPTIKPNADPGDKALEVSSVTRLDTQFPTLGKLVKQAGYTTGHFGKWHLGSAPYSPLEHGFDVDIPHTRGPGPGKSYIAPWSLELKPNYPKEHIEDRMAEEAVAWMNSVNGEEPFFMNYWQFSVHGPWIAKQELIDQYKEKVKPGEKQRSPTYAAMIETMDDAIGSLLDAVDAAGIAEQTVIIFVSDNGGNMHSNVDDTIPTDNFPLRGGKATMYEGGIRVPCVVVWPGVTEPGTRSDEMIQTSDFYPTLLNQFGIQIPADHPVDGIDITSALGGGQLDREGIVTYFPTPPPVPNWLPPAISLHSGDWKLFRLFHQGEDGAHAYRLYNLAEDIGEQNNLAAQYPERVQEMDRIIETQIQETGGVVPVPNPRFDPTQYRPELIGVSAGRHMKKPGKNRKAAKTKK